MNWNFDIKKDAAVKELIKLAEKYEYDVDMDTIAERAANDAGIYVSAPQVQADLVEQYDAKLKMAPEKAKSAPFYATVAAASEAQFQKSLPHLKILLEKYTTASKDMVAKYHEAFSQQVEKEIGKQWDKTRPPEFWVKKDQPAPEGAAPAAPEKAPLGAEEKPTL
jgi:hypothetical protein